MAHYETTRRHRSAPRNPSVLAHDLRWSMAYERPVRVTDATGHVTTARVVSLLRDPEREGVMAKLRGDELKQRSSLLATFETGKVLAVDSITRVQRPLGETGRAFAAG